jgi:hypothetical protein
VWIVAAIAVVLVGYASTWLFSGSENMPNPFNFWNFIATLLALAPGICLILLGQRIEARHARSSSKITPPA